MRPQKSVVRALILIIAALALQACASKAALTAGHADLNHIQDGLAVITVRLQGPYILYSITLRNLDTGDLYGDLYFFDLPRDNVGDQEQDRQHDLFIDMPPGRYVVQAIKISHEAGFTDYSLRDGDFLFAEYFGGSPAYLGELYVSVDKEIKRTGLTTRVSNLYFATSKQHDAHIQRLKNRYRALATSDMQKGKIWLQ